MNPLRDTLQRIKAATPDTRIVARIYRDDSKVDGRIRANAQEAARWMDELIRGHECFGLAD